MLCNVRWTWASLSVETNGDWSPGLLAGHVTAGPTILSVHAFQLMPKWYACCQCTLDLNISTRSTCCQWQCLTLHYPCVQDTQDIEAAQQQQTADHSMSDATDAVTASADDELP